MDCVHSTRLDAWERQQANYEAGRERYNDIQAEADEIVKEIADFIAPRVEKLALLVGNNGGELKKAMIYQGLEKCLYTVEDMVREMNIVNDLLHELPRD